MSSWTYRARHDDLPFFSDTTLEVMDVEVDDNGCRPCIRRHVFRTGQPDQRYWVLMTQAEIERWWVPNE